MDKVLTGKIDPSRIKLIEVPRLPAEILAGFRALGDVVCAVSDALDELGLRGAVGASTLVPTEAGTCIVGSALTIRNALRREDPMTAVRDKDNRMAEIEAHNLAQPDDVLVIQGVSGISNMGGVGAQIGKRQGEVGAIVDGGIRDVADFRALSYPVWSTGRTPLTGKWRLEAVEINGPVTICGMAVQAGDLVVADDTGVCFVPRERAAEVLAFARKKTKAEQDKAAEVARGLSVPELAGVKAAR